jgi:dihydrofolate reductase
MRKIIAGFASSLDGFIEGPNGEIDWIVNDPEHFKEYSRQWEDLDTMLYGRKTYETVIRYSTKEQTAAFSHMKHYVFSRTLEKVEPGFILCRGDLAEEIRLIKNQKGKDIAVFGGAILLSALINLKLVDELVIILSPVLLGKGKPFFTNIEERNYLNLKSAKSYPSGLMVLIYEIRRT